MPERLAATSPHTPVAEISGSGPYRFLSEEHVSGARAAFERFALYQPRSSGAVGFTAGPKIAHFDRVEWLTLDPFSAMAALQNGEMDRWEAPPRDLVEQIARNRNIAVVSQYATGVGILRFNHLFRPFDNPAIRRALSFDLFMNDLCPKCRMPLKLDVIKPHPIMVMRPKRPITGPHGGIRLDAIHDVLAPDGRRRSYRHPRLICA
jgi:hypothetical protein